MWTCDVLCLYIVCLFSPTDNLKFCSHSSVSSVVFRGKVSERLQPEKMSLDPCLKLTATDGRGVKLKRQWVPDNWSCDEEAPPFKHQLLFWVCRLQPHDVGSVSCYCCCLQKFAGELWICCCNYLASAVYKLEGIWSHTVCDVCVSLSHSISYLDCNWCNVRGIFYFVL